MPNNPHSSWNRSSSRHVALKSAPPRAFDPVQRDIHDRLGSEPEREPVAPGGPDPPPRDGRLRHQRSEEHTSELQSPCNLVCRLLLEKKKKTNNIYVNGSIADTTSSRPHSLNSS